MIADERYIEFNGEEGLELDDAEDVDPEVEEACEELLTRIEGIRNHYDLDNVDRMILGILEEIIELL